MSAAELDAEADAASDVDVVCLPPAGGSTASFRAWRDRGVPGLRLYPQPPPRSLDRPGPGLLGAAVQLADQIRTVGNPARPLVVAGHSVGGLLACEVARRLCFTGARRLTAVVVMGCRPLHMSSAAYFRPIIDLPDRELLVGLDRLGVIHPRLRHSPLWPMVLPKLRSDLRLICAYDPPADDPLPVPIHAWHGSDDPLAPPSLGLDWQRHTGAGLQVRVFDGDHFFPVALADQVLPALAAVAFETPTRTGV